MTLACCLALAGLVSVQDPNDAIDAMVVPNCAVTAVFTIVRLEGIQTPLSDVASRFPERESETYSIAVVRKVLHSFGIKTAAIHVSPKDLKHVNSPAILYFAPGRWPRTENTGHFVALIRQDAETATVADWNRFSPESQLPRVALEQAWSGTVIILDRHQPSSLPQLFAVAAIAVFAWGCWLGADGKCVRPVILILVVLWCFAGFGCTHSVSVPTPNQNPPITCETPLVNLGHVDGSQLLETSFELVVSAKHPVTIKSITKACGCTTVAEDLIGRALAPESKHTLRVTVRPDGDEGQGPIVRVITLMTDSSTSTPVTVAVQYQRRSRPRISVSEVLVETTPQRLASVTIHVTHRRNVSDSPIRVVSDSINSKDFSLIDLKFKTEVVDRGPTPSAGKLAIDRTEIRLMQRELRNFGDHRGVMQIGFADKSVQTISTRISVPHPFRPLVPHMFLGQQKPGQTILNKVRIRRSSNFNAQVREIESTIATIHGKLNSDDEIEISGSAPETGGRWKGELRVHFDDPSVQAVEIPFSGIVSDEP